MINLVDLIVDTLNLKTEDFEFNNIQVPVISLYGDLKELVETSETTEDTYDKAVINGLRHGEEAMVLVEDNLDEDKVLSIIKSRLSKDEFKELAIGILRLSKMKELIALEDINSEDVIGVEPEEDEVPGDTVSQSVAY